MGGIKKYFLTLLILILVVAFIGCSTTTGRDKTTQAKTPNFLIIITDDQRYDTMDYMPLTKSAIFDEGITFTNGYVTTPLCCPSRASILTGMYAHTTGVRGNGDSLNEKTFIDYLHDNGYYTGMVGKYLNSWDGSYRDEFDFWVAFRSGMGKSRKAEPYNNPELNVNGDWKKHSGYTTYILRDYVLEFLDKVPKEKQFALVFAPNAPHQPADPAPEDKALYLGIEKHRPQNFNEDDVLDKPKWLQDLDKLSEREIVQIDKLRIKQLQSLASLDRSIAEILKILDKQGKLNDTFIVFISDNGYFWGEHRIDGKSFVYEEAIRVPFAIRYPQLISENGQREDIVANIDIAPTIYELVGIAAPENVDGVSLVEVLKGGTLERKAILIEGGGPTHGLRAKDEAEGEKIASSIYSAIVTRDYVYIENKNDISEFYDLSKDPYQLENKINDKNYADIIREMKQQLGKMS